MNVDWADAWAKDLIPEFAVKGLPRSGPSSQTRSEAREVVADALRKAAKGKRSDEPMDMRKLCAWGHAVRHGVEGATRGGWPIVAAKSFTRVYPNGCPDADVYEWNLAFPA